jgi:hypothetical protein
VSIDVTDKLTVPPAALAEIGLAKRDVEAVRQCDLAQRCGSIPEA